MQIVSKGDNLLCMKCETYFLKNIWENYFKMPFAETFTKPTNIKTSE